MDLERTSLSTTLLRAVLEGRTYETVARAHNLTRTAVERRVKSRVLRLMREVGVDGLNESRARFVRQLRAHRMNIEAALACDTPIGASQKTAEAVVLSDEDIRTALRRARLHTRTPERDEAMVWILLATGLRPLEVARMEVADYLHAHGGVRVRSRVRSSVAVNRRERPLYFSSAAARAAIDAYLATRGGSGAKNDASTLGSALPYRGLDPQSALFLAPGGCAFQVEITPTASGKRCLCQEIHDAYRKIFRSIGFPGLSALNVRYTVMDRLTRRGAHESQIGELLGIHEFRRLKRPRLSLDQLMYELV